jgi:hypothetical protein
VPAHLLYLLARGSVLKEEAHNGRQIFRIRRLEAVQHGGHHPCLRQQS